MRASGLAFAVIPSFLGIGSLAAGCAKDAATSGSGSKLAIDIAPLQLDGIADATWRITVTTPVSATPVWQKTIRSSEYGDGRGAATYVGPCDRPRAPTPTVSRSSWSSCATPRAR